MAKVFPFASDKPKPPALDAPVAKKAAVVPFGPKHEAAETPAYEAKEEASMAKIAYVRSALQDLIAMLGDDDEEEPAEEMPEEEPVEAE